MTANIIQLQDQYLQNLSNESIAVSIYLINGIKLSGLISAYDEQIVLLSDEKSTTNQLIYKHAISTIVPSKITTSNNKE